MKMFVKLEMNNKKIKSQLDAVSDVTYVNDQTWKKIGRLNLLKTEKNCRWHYWK